MEISRRDLPKANIFVVPPPRGSMVIRLRPCIRSSTSLLSSTPPPPRSARKFPAGRGVLPCVLYNWYTVDPFCPGFCPKMCRHCPRIADFFNSGCGYQAVGETVLRRGLHSRCFQRMGQANEHQEAGENVGSAGNYRRATRKINTRVIEIAHTPSDEFQNCFFRQKARVHRNRATRLFMGRKSRRDIYGTTVLLFWLHVCPPPPPFLGQNRV